MSVLKFTSASKRYKFEAQSMRIINGCRHYPECPKILHFLYYTPLQSEALNLYKLFIIFMLIMRSQSILDISFQ